MHCDRNVNAIVMIAINTPKEVEQLPDVAKGFIIANTIYGSHACWGSDLKVTKEKIEENRAALLTAAGRLFRTRGVEGVGVAEISKEAGLTHGALYAQFGSKEALAAEALAQGLHVANQFIASGAGAPTPGITGQLDYFLSHRHRDDPATGCAMAASASEMSRYGKEISKRFAEGFSELVDIFEAGMAASPLKADQHERAQTLVAALIGSVAVARATAKGNPKLSAQVLASARKVLGELSGEVRTFSGDGAAVRQRGTRKRS
jgi:TetR/AcrR family transcriptional regulator, transcriptional repressor for nem operon